MSRPEQIGSNPEMSATMAEPVSDPALVGGRYLITKVSGEPKLLGKSTFARVFEAADLETGQPVAVKLARAGAAAAKDHLEREGRIVTAVGQHPNLMPLFDSGVDPDDNPYIIMPVARHSLAHIIMDDRETASLATQALAQTTKGLAHMHRKALHQDVKPENVRLRISDDGVRVWVADFGNSILHLEAEEGPLIFFDDGRLEANTLEGETMPFGYTPNFSAPEISSAQDCSPTIASDLYSLGCTMQAVLTPGPTRPTIDSEVTITDKVPSEWIEIVRALKEKDPDNRIPEDELLRTLPDLVI